MLSNYKLSVHAELISRDRLTVLMIDRMRTNAHFSDKLRQNGTRVRLFVTYDV